MKVSKSNAKPLLNYWTGSRLKKGITFRYASEALFEHLLSICANSSNWTNSKVPIRFCNSSSQPLMKDLTIKMDILQTTKSLERVPQYHFYFLQPILQRKNIKTYQTCKNSEKWKPEKKKKKKRSPRLMPAMVKKHPVHKDCASKMLSFTRKIQEKKKVSVCEVLNSNTSYVNSLGKQVFAQTILMK